MRIAICDDNENTIQEVKGFLEKYNRIKELTNEILCFPKPSKLYAYMEYQEVDMIFMDLEFREKEEDGILWSDIIKKKYPNVLIIILTSYEKRFKEGFMVKAFRFMTKPIIEQEMFEGLDCGMEELTFAKTISLVRRGINYTIPIQDICYLAAQSGGSELWSRTDMFYCEESLVQWEQKLPEDLFFRCHHKYLVNLMNVTKVEPQRLILVNGEQVPVSRRRWKSFQIAYMRWDTRHM